MAYVKILYQDSPSTATPLNAQNLNHMDDQIALNDQRLSELEGAHVSSFNGRTGAVTPADGDYDIGQIAPLTGAQVGQVPVVTNIGTEEEPELVFRMGAGGGAGGHEIIASDGTQMPQESAMQFPDSHVSDDSTNGRTVVENVKEVTLAELSQATERGMYLATDEESVPIGASSEDYVEVEQVTGGTKTYSQLLDELFALVDFSKLSEATYIQYGSRIYELPYKVSTQYDFVYFYLSWDGKILASKLSVKSTGSIFIDNNNGTITDNSSTVASVGEKFTFYYGTSSTVINLKTSADYCMMSDGVTSVESALTWKSWKTYEPTSDNVPVALPPSFNELIINIKVASSVIYGNFHVLQSDLTNSDTLYRVGFYESTAYNSNVLMWINNSQVKSRVFQNNGTSTQAYLDIRYR